MLFYIIRRLITALVMLLVVSLTTFLLFFAGPTDPARATCAKNCTPAVVEANRKFLGFDKPIPQQYADFMQGLVAGRDYPSDEKLRKNHPEQVTHCGAPCLGFSAVKQKTVNEIIGGALPITISIALAAFVLWMVVGVSLGIVAGLNKGRFIDRLIVGLALIGYSLPTFFIGLILLNFVAIKWSLWPMPAYTSFTENPLKWAQGLLLPASTLAAIYAASYVRLTRNFMIETMSEDYIRTARAKGLKPRTVVFRHGFRAVLTPIVTAAGLDLGVLLGGAVISESVFNFQGLGWWSWQSVNNADLPIVVGIVCVAATFVIVANLIVDVLYGIIDPRVRLA